MSKARAKPRARGRPKKPRPVTVAPQPWDHGATGPANRRGLRVEPATDFDHDTGKERSNPNGVTRVRRMEPIEAYLRQGRITVGQAATAREMRDASEVSRNADPLAAIQSHVDRPSGPFEPCAGPYDARHKYRDMMACVPPASRPVVEHVAIGGYYVTAMPGGTKGGASARHMQRLRDGLDAVREKWGRRGDR